MLECMQILSIAFIFTTIAGVIFHLFELDRMLWYWNYLNTLVYNIIFLTEKMQSLYYIDFYKFFIVKKANETIFGGLEPAFS